MSESPDHLLAIKLVGAKKPAFLGGETSGSFGATDYTRTDIVRTQTEAAVKRALDGAAAECRKQAEVFGSDKYAVGQPMASFSERFACEKCSDAIRALDPAQFIEGDKS